MTIQEVFHIIDGAFQNLQQEGVIDQLLREQRGQAITQQDKDAAAAACEQFCQHNRWPKMSALQTLLVFQRIESTRLLLDACLK